KVFDGVKLTVQRSGGENRSSVMKKTVFPNELIVMDTSFAVNAGDIVYFWVESNDRHTLDAVQWNPVIAYSSSQPIITENNVNASSILNSEPQNFVFNAAQDFIVNGKAQNLKMPVSGSVRIAVSITASELLKEPLSFIATKNNGTIISNTFAQNTAINYNYSTYSGVQRGDSLMFMLECPGRIDWTKVDVKVKVYYTYAVNDDTGNTLEVLDNTVSPARYIMSYTPVVGKKTYHYAKQPSQKVQLNFFNSIFDFYRSFTPSITYRSNPLLAAGVITITVKDGQGNLIADGRFRKSRALGSLTTEKACRTIRNLNGNYYIDFYIEDADLSNEITDIKAKINDSGSYSSGLYTNYKSQNYLKFENIYRSWTQFGYKPKDSNLSYIDESLLNLDYMTEENIDSVKLNDMLPSGGDNEITDIESIDIPDFTDRHPEDELDGGINPLAGNFFIMNPDFEKKQYASYAELASIRKDTMYNCFIHSDVTTTILRVRDEGLPVAIVTAGEKPKTIIKKMTAKPYSARVAGIFLGYAYSENQSALESDYMDMNGDRYPDIVGLRSVQYSKPQGGLSKKVENVLDGVINVSTTATHSGSASTASVQAAKQLASNIKMGKVAVRGSGGGGFSITGGSSGALATDETDMTLMDINGDGLPDKVFRNGMAFLNLGYKFSPVPVNYSNLKIGESASFTSGASLGGGYDFSQAFKNFDIIYSISGGISTSTANNMTKSALMDVNGDGLVDMVKLDNNILNELVHDLVSYLTGGLDLTNYWGDRSDVIKVAYNTGTGFTGWQNLATADETRMGTQINLSDSRNFGANAAVTIGFPLGIIPLKITVTLAGGGSWSVSSEKYKLMDFNNDGYPDMVSADNNFDFNYPDSVVVSYAKPSPGNLLTGIISPVKLRTEIGYSLSTKSTTENPSRNWEMTSCKNIYYLYDCNLKDEHGHKSTFEYYNRKYNRFERDDYGYQKVVTKLHNNDNIDWVAYGQIHEDAPYVSTMPVSRIIEDAYDIDNYLSKGLKLSRVLKDTSGNIFTKTVYSYLPKDIKSGDSITAENAHCLGSAYLPLSTET
ncbi:MAG: hypothetical protein LBC49_00040, partial [Bacteroidales bacterium]|nr:hypothetical protein [Bacteroidales bacterium]